MEALHDEPPFWVRTRFAFQTDYQIFFVMDFAKGGNLLRHLRLERRFPEEVVRFYAIQIAISLQTLHSKQVIYRNLKPENVLLEEDGYICLTDFRYSEKMKNRQPYASCSGTPDYLAPELLEEEVKCTKAVDWWALGVLIYELTIGSPPFFTGHRLPFTMHEKIKHEDVYFPHAPFLSANCRDFIIKLLNKKPEERLGVEDFNEVLSHPWFEGLDKD